jgi:hypothetical protein
MPTLGSLVSGLTPITSRRKADVYLVELDKDDNPVAEAAPMGRRFQYFPETISDTKAVNYATKEIPGGSLPLYQWVNSGARTLAFTAVFTTDVDHSRGVDDSALPAFGDPLQDFQDRLEGSAVQDHNAYIPGALTWLRRYMFPKYGEESGVGTPLTEPPPKLELVFPAQSHIERMGGIDAAGITCIMTGCDINYESFFPSGNIRIATCSLAFAQVAQRGGTVTFPSRLDESELPAPEVYKFETRTFRETGLQGLLGKIF